MKQKTDRKTDRLLGLYNVLKDRRTSRSGGTFCIDQATGNEEKAIANILWRAGILKFRKDIIVHCEENNIYCSFKIYSTVNKNLAELCEKKA